MFEDNLPLLGIIIAAGVAFVIWIAKKSITGYYKGKSEGYKS